MDEKTDIESYLKSVSVVINGVLEKWLPRGYDSVSLSNIVGKPRYAYDAEAVNRTIAEPVWEFLDRGGKRWRPALMLLVAEALGAPRDRVLDFVVIPECVHNGTLMVDDIEDRSELRRGKPCTHRIFGVDIAINAGNAMYFLPLTVMMSNSARLAPDVIAKLYNIYAREMISVSFGQAMDIAWHNGMADADNITEKEYMQMCAYKTGTLARMAAKFGAVIAGADEEVVEKTGRFAEAIGVAFQIQDDILNIRRDRGWGKEYGEDIKEGKRTLMVIHALQHVTKEERGRLVQILNEHTSEREKLSEAMDLIRKYGSVEYAEKYAKRMVEEAWLDMEGALPPSEAKDKLKAFAYFLIERNF